MNETVSKIMDELDQFSLHFAFAYAEPNDRGEDILVFTCRELPHREFIYVPGKKGMTLGWDTKQCPLAPAILEEFRRYWQEEAHWKVNEILEDIASYRERLAGELSHKERGEWEQALRWAQEALEEEKETGSIVIEDEETPLAAPIEEQSRMSWWWLLIAVLGVTGEEMYRRHRKKMQEEMDA